MDSIHVECVVSLELLDITPHIPCFESSGEDLPELLLWAHLNSDKVIPQQRLDFVARQRVMAEN